jgi:hypothetical protein
VPEVSRLTLLLLEKLTPIRVSSKCTLYLQASGVTRRPLRRNPSQGFYSIYSVMALIFKDSSECVCGSILSNAVGALASVPHVLIVVPLMFPSFD